MLQLLWFATGLLLGLFAKRHPVVSFGPLLVLLLMVPFIAAGSITGTSTHPVVLVTLGLIPSTLAVSGKYLVGFVSDNTGRLLVLALGLTFMAISEWANGGLLHAAQSMVRLLVPVAVAVMVAAHMQPKTRFLGQMRALMLALGVVQVVVTISVWLTGAPFLYLRYYSLYYWFDLSYTRGMGTTDHPLILSLFLVICIALSTTLKSTRVYLVLACVYVVGLLLSESRVGLVVGIALVGFSLLRRNLSLGQRMGATIACAIAAIPLFAGELAEDLLEKFVDDSGSANARLQAIDAFLQNLGEYWLVGGGAGAASDFAKNEGLATSLESAGMIYAVEYGLVGTVLFFIGVFLFARPFGRGHLDGFGIGALAAIVIVNTFSSLVTTGASDFLLWIAAAFSAGGAQRAAASDYNSSQQSLPAFEVART